MGIGMKQAGPHAELVQAVASNQSQSHPTLRSEPNYAFLLLTEPECNKCITVHQMHPWLEFWRDLEPKQDPTKEIEGRVWCQTYSRIIPTVQWAPCSSTEMKYADSFYFAAAQHRERERCEYLEKWELQF